MNILYDTNATSNKLAAFMGTVSKWAGSLVIPEAEINASYLALSKSIPNCLKDTIQGTTTIISQEERVCMRTWISKQYKMIEESDTDSQVFKMDMYGEDLFANGNSEDSAYDIMIDIQNIGNLLFTSFIGPKETLFYKLPSSKS